MYVYKRTKETSHFTKVRRSIPRFSPTCKHLPYIKQKAAKLQKGYSGERRLEYYLRSLSNDYHILSDVSLEVFNKEFQIDSLIISPQAMYLIEVKNFDGILTFNTTHRQMIQTNNNQEITYTYLLTQADIKPGSRCLSCSQLNMI